MTAEREGRRTGLAWHPRARSTYPARNLTYRRPPPRSGEECDDKIPSRLVVAGITGAAARAVSCGEARRPRWLAEGRRPTPCNEFSKPGRRRSTWGPAAPGRVHASSSVARRSPPSRIEPATAVARHPNRERGTYVAQRSKRATSNVGCRDLRWFRMMNSTDSLEKIAVGRYALSENTTIIKTINEINMPPVALL